MALIPVESVSSYDTRQWKYDVLLCRGEDACVSFTDNLYLALVQEGIRTFNGGVRRHVISPTWPSFGAIMEERTLRSREMAIEESRISVIILSRSYAYITWCLDELVKILKCRKEKGQIVLPVFYDVHPSDVRKQKGCFEEAFARHEEHFKENLERVQTWRSALTEVANLSGWDLQDMRESKLIKQIVKAILDALATRYLNSSTELLVGMDSRVEEIFSYLEIGLTDVRIIGMCGISGVGKSTIARVAYERLFGQFEASCFLANIRQVAQKFGLICLQEILLSTILKERVTRINGVLEGVKQIRNRLHAKRILLVLDDVDQLEQLNILAGEHDFFGQGSRIIITSRDKNLLRMHKVDQIYEPKKLSNEEALELFSLKSFNSKHPPKDYIQMSNLFVNYIGGLPLALKVIGSSLCQKSNKEWESLAYGVRGSSLRQKSNKEWKSALGKILSYPERKILDVLKILSFDGLDYMEKKIFLHIACFFEGMDKDLVIKMLVSLGFYVDYSLQILIEKSLLEVSSDNRLCMHYLIQQMGREIVRQECVKGSGRRGRLWTHGDIDRVLRNNTLQKLYLNGTAIKELSSSILHLTGLNLLDLSDCGSLERIIELLWVGVKFLNNLTSIDLSYSRHLVQIPDFTGVQNLEELYLEGCTNLIEVHSSVAVLKRLLCINLSDCIRLRSLPSKIETESLRVLILSGCSNVKVIPDFAENMQQLCELYLNGTAINKLPSSIGNLRNLAMLDLRDCKNLGSPHRKIAAESFAGWHLKPIVPPIINQLLWEGVEILNNLTVINLSYSRNLIQTPDFTGVPNLEKIYLRGCTNLIEVHSSVAVLKRLIFMDLKDCIRLRSLPSRIETESLEILILSGCSNVKVIPDFAENMQQLRKLYVNGTAIEKLPSSIEHLTGLIVLDLSHCKNLSYLPRTIIRLEYLREFVVSGCSKLAKFEDHETASAHEPEIELISSKTPKSSHAHETKDVEISSGAETESVFSQIKGESQLSKLTMHVKEPIEPATPQAVSTSGTNKGATVEPFLSESSKLFELPDPETKPISLEKPELLSAHGTKVMEKKGKTSIPETEIEIVPSQPTEEGTSKQAAVEPMSVSDVMGADREVQMEGLLPEEAWKLFREQVGGIIESPNIQQFARAIVRKCHGFPLLIIVTGRALAKENDALAWMHASKEFSQCSAHGIYGYEALIQKLKFSYDRLEGPDVKSCFLYCALFPEDQEISIDELVDYWIQEGLVAGNRPDSYKRGRGIVDILVGASLLQSVQVGLSIKMHYLIRDLASRILSLEVEGCQFLCGSHSKMTQLSHTGNRLPILEYHRFLSRAGAGLIELPLKEEWEEAKMIFFMDNELTSLPERPNCPRLLALFLQRNHNLRVIPTSFFNLMPSLTILNLSKTRIKFLPKSICELTILEVLILRDCERLVQLPSDVGSLRQLMVLDLQGTKLNKLSNQISKLAYLRHLKVSFYGTVNQSEYDNLPRELLSHVVIRNLSELETLSIDVYPGDMRWNKNVESVIDEVSNLTNLTTFCCYFPKVEFLQRFLRKSAIWKIGGLTEFKFVVGHDVKRFASHNVDNLEFDYVQWGQCLRFVNGEMIPSAVLEVLTRTSAFCLDHHINVLSLSEFGLGNFNGLRLCVVRECPKIQEIIAGAELSDAVFPILERLSVNYLPDLTMICKEMIPQGSFAKLRALTVHTCRNLEFVFAGSMLQCFSNLEELIVEDCSAIKKIVDSDSGTLPSLKRLKLHYLPNLVNIMEGAWPPLENISFYDCPMLKKLGIDSNLIRTIKEIKAEIDWWGKLEWQDSSLYSHLQACFTVISDEDL